MKRIRVSSTLLAFGLLVCNASAFSLNLGGGYIQTQGAGTNAPANSLLQIIISPDDNVFNAPTIGDFAPGDDIIAYEFAINELAGPGTFGISTTNMLGYTVGDQMILRWFPSLTTASDSPVGGEWYGEFRTDSVIDGSDIAWLVPGDGTWGLNFLTSALGGSNPDSAGIANLQVVPEPSTYALLAFGFALASVARVRLRNRRR